MFFPASVTNIIIGIFERVESIGELVGVYEGSAEAADYHAHISPADFFISAKATLFDAWNLGNSRSGRLTA